MNPFALLGAATIVFVAAPAFAATYSGVAKTPAVVWVTDVAPSPPPDAAIHQTMKSFVPDLLVIPIGTSVAFPNDDAFYHSVYSESIGNEFDLGLYDTGPGKNVRFTAPGVVDVRCHVHGTMHATIVVVDGPYAQTTQPNQRYRITGIRPGHHFVHVYTGTDDVAVTNVLIK